MGRSLLHRKILNFFYGRKNNNTGILINLTDGGEGSFGLVPSEETKKKTSISLRGHKRNSIEIHKSLTKRMINGVYDRLKRKIVRIEGCTEIIYNSLTEASHLNKIPRSTLHLTLNNKTNKNGTKYLAGGYDWKYT